MSIGPFFIPPFLLILIVVTAAVYLGHRIFFKKKLQAIRLFWSILGDMLLAGILLWKLSPLLLAPREIFRDPITLLYRPGGIVGLFVGCAGATAVAVYRMVREKKRPPRFLRFALISLLVLALGSAAALSLLPVAGPVSGSPAAPAASASPGSRKRLSMELLGNSSFFEEYRREINWEADYLVLNFWAVWCPPCRAEIPELSDFYRGTDRDRIELIGINMTSSEKSAGSVLAFLEENGIDYPVLLDVEGLLSDHFLIESLPTTLVIGPSGEILVRKAGVIDRLWLNNHTR